MRLTVPAPGLSENASTEREVFELVNQQRDALNRRYQWNFGSQTAPTFITQTIWQSDDMPLSAVWEVEAQVVGLATDGSAGGYRRVGRFKRSAGGVSTLVGAVATPFADAEDVAGWDVTMAVDLAHGVIVNVTGDGVRTVNWAAFIQINERK